MSSSLPVQPAPRRKLTGFQRLALITTLATYFLIMVGGFVRASGSGLGCPDWPKCFGYWVPPGDASMLPPEYDHSQYNQVKMWIEYGNRLVGVAVGFLIIATTVAALRKYRNVPRVLWPTVASFVLVLFQGWLGKVVVELELAGWIVTAHLILALVIVSLLVYATVCAFFPGGKPLAQVPADRLRLARLAQGVTILSLIQLTLGALVRGHLDNLSKQVPPLPRGEWIDHVGLTDHLHRFGALAVTAGVLWLAWVALRDRQLHAWLHRFAWAMAVLVLIQVAAGVGLAYGALPPPLQTIHIICGTLLIGALTTFILLAYRLPAGTAAPARLEQLAGAEA
ncbi:MAG TPA: COX15/CtaA family protein [Herpetosiphonaceae bacterium]